MEKTIVRCGNLELSFVDSDIANPDDLSYELDWHWRYEKNNHKQTHKLWLLHDHGFTVCVVCAETLQDALDIAVDNDKLDRYLIEEEGNTPGKHGLSREDYPTIGTEDEEGITRLGNASEPFDIESLGWAELPLPGLSITKLYGNEIEALHYRF